MADKISVLIAEDDENDIYIYERGLNRIGIENFKCVRDGAEVIEYLRGQGKYQDREQNPFPKWLLLDLKMPRVNGLEVLEWIKKNPSCRVVPTIIFSASQQASDVKKAYDLGANAYFVKPLRMEEMLETLALVNHFWTIAVRPSVEPQHTCT